MIDEKIDPRTPEQVAADEAVQQALEQSTFSRLSPDEARASLARARAIKRYKGSKEAAATAVVATPIHIYSFESVSETILAGNG